MEFSILLEERRSIRDYQPNVQISKEDIEKMIYAAQQAPSWKNSQTGRYYVAITKEGVARVREVLPGFNSERTQNAVAYIVTTYKTKISGHDGNGNPTDANGDAWGAYDLGLQNENLLLKACELGYDTLIMGLRDEAALKKLFSIPNDEAIMSVIAVGKRTATPEKPQRKNINDIAKII
jgi:nitroreductase